MKTRDLREQLEQIMSGSVCFMGLGNVDYGDDGFGVRLAEELIAAGIPDVVVAGTTPDRWISHFASFDHVVFLDAAEFGGAPGSVVLLDSSEIAARFPQISTHKISVGILAHWVELTGASKAWLLGVQPESLRESGQLSSALQLTLTTLRDLLSILRGELVSEAAGKAGA